MVVTIVPVGCQCTAEAEHKNLEIVHKFVCFFCSRLYKNEHWCILETHTICYTPKKKALVYTKNTEDLLYTKESQKKILTEKFAVVPRGHHRT